MQALLFTIIANGLLSIGSYVLLSLVPLTDKHVGKVILFLMSLSGGVLLGTAFIHLLPEAAMYLSPDILFPTILASFLLFYVIEKLIHWRHCHDMDCTVHTFGYMNLVGDAVHNLIDGIIIGATFVQSTSLGIVSALTILLHELPKEVSDFGVLLYAGFTRKKALLFNFFVGLGAVVGGVIGYFLAETIRWFIGYMLPFAAGGFLYIAASDLIPEMRKETARKKSALSFGVLLLGIAITVIMKLVGGE